MLTEVAEIPLVRRWTILWLIVCLGSNSQSTALKLSSYHARVLVVTFLRYFRFSLNSEVNVIFGAFRSQVVDSKGG